MSVDAEMERLRAAFASRSGQAPGPACPAPERLWSAARGERPPAEVRPLVLHLAECGACAEAWRLAREVDAPAPSPAAATRPRPAGPAWIRWGALAATVVLAAGAAIALRQRSEPAPEFREGMRGGIRSLVPETQSLPRTRCVLRWSPGPDGTTYNLTVATAGLEKVAEARGLTAASYEVPPRALASLPPGARLLWQVEAVAPDGSRATSATFVSRVE
jgi:hypothetical protein